MRILGILLVALFVLCSNAIGQARFAGKVVEVIDGRTMIVDTGAGRVTTQLQYIETPEPEQPLYRTVRDHLANLALGKVVEFRPLRLHDKLTVGRVEMGGVDLSLQLIRDGAAWHEPPDTSGQPANESEEYASNQLSAKVEKRGVWSVPNLKTPWQIRAEKQAALDRVDKETRSKKPVVVGVNQFQTVSRRPGPAAVDNNWDSSARPDHNAWGDVFAGVGKETHGLQTYTDPKGRFDSIYTSAAFVSMDGGKVERRVECRLMLVSVNSHDGRRETIYLLGFQSVADDYHFSKQKSRLTLTHDKRNVPVGVPVVGLRGDSAIGTRELFFYRLTKAQLRSIGSARNLEMRIDGMLGTVPADARDLFKQLAATAN